MGVKTGILLKSKSKLGNVGNSLHKERGRIRHGWLRKKETLMHWREFAGDGNRKAKIFYVDYLVAGW